MFQTVLLCWKFDEVLMKTVLTVFLRHSVYVVLELHLEMHRTVGLMGYIGPLTLILTITLVH